MRCLERWVVVCCILDLIISETIPPLLNGVFYELYTDVAAWNLSQWRQELASMKAVDISYVAIRTVYDANYPS